MNCSNLAITTAEDIAVDLRNLGISPGDLACLHVSLSALGFVPGGVRTLIEGVLSTLDGGTLMMPSYSGDLSDPAEWKHPPVPANWVERIREATPAYDLEKTPTRAMGAVSEYFRSYPGVKRSAHPQSSFTALGPLAEQLLHPHPLDNRFGPEGPLGRLKSMNGWVILMGAPWDTVSLFHMTQHLVGWSSNVPKSAPIMIDGKKVWAPYSDIEYPVDWFEDAVAMLLESGIAKIGNVGRSTTVVFKSDDAIDEVVSWRKRENR